MENNEQKKTKTKRKGWGPAIWISVILLLILVLTTVALLGATLKHWPQGDTNVIALFPSDPNNKSVYTIDRVPADFEPAVSIGKVPGVGEDGSVDGPMYESGNVVDLFKNTYLNEKGQVIVQSSNGDRVVAPGTSNKYQFTMKNTGNISLDYTMKLDGAFAYGDSDLPIVTRLSYGNEWIFGGPDSWVPWNQMQDVYDTRTIESGKTAVYTFEWKWPYEADTTLLDNMNDALLEADKNDTSLGNAATDTSTKFDLNIRTIATPTEGAVAVDSFGTRLFTTVFNKLDVTYIGLYIIIIIIVALALEALFVYIFIIKRRKEEEEDPDPDPAPTAVPIPVLMNDAEAVPAMAEPVEESEDEVLEEAPAEEPVEAETPEVLEEAPAEEPVEAETPEVLEEAPAEEPVQEEIPEAAEDTPAVDVDIDGGVIVAAASENDNNDAALIGLAAIGTGAILVSYRSSYMSRLIQAEGNLQDYYTEIKNALLSYKGVKSKVSWNCETFTRSRLQCAKINVKGKVLLVYLGLDPNEYSESKHHFTNASDKPKFENVPMLMKVKSDRGLKYTLELIDELMAKNGIEKGEEQNIDYRMPYETNEELVKRGLVKVITPPGVTLDDDANLQSINVGEVIDAAKANAVDQSGEPEVESGDETIEAEAPEAAEEIAEAPEAEQAVEEPKIEEIPVIIPVIEEPAVEEPEAEEPVAEEAVVEEPKIEEAPIVIPVIEEALEEEDEEEEEIVIERTRVILTPGTEHISRPARVAKTSINNRVPYTDVCIGEFAPVYDSGSIVNLKNLKEKGVISKETKRIKINARGELGKPLDVYADAFSVEAERKIERDGGKAILVERRPRTRK